METASTMTGTRLVGGVELPMAGRWVIDPGHTEVAFIGRHLMLTKVRGRFTGVQGVVDVADDPEDSTAELTIDMASVDSGSPMRDDHLRSADLFDIATHPTAAFRGRARGWSGRMGRLVGDLTIKDVTRPVTLDVEYLGTVTDPWGSVRSMFSATGTVNRDDWGVSWNTVLDGGGLLVSEEIRIEIEIETTLEM